MLPPVVHISSDVMLLYMIQNELGIPLDEQELQKAMERLDTNQDGTLEKSEFVNWWIDKSMNWEVDDELSKKVCAL